MTTYRFCVPNNILVQRGSESFVPWNPVLNQPNDIEGSAGRQWRADGSPIPDSYIAPGVTAEETRRSALLADTDRQNFLDNIATHTPQEIKNYIANNVTDLASAKLMLARIALLVALNLRT
jgi:hypothetical protein